MAAPAHAIVPACRDPLPSIRVKRIVRAAFAAVIFTTSLTHAAAPTALLCDLLAHPEKTVIANPTPSFGWVVPTTAENDIQSAFEIIVTTDSGEEMWKTGKLASPRSIDIKYAGKPLQPRTKYAWKVRTWNRAGDAGDFSAPQTFTTADKLDEPQVAHYAIETTH